LSWESDWIWRLEHQSRNKLSRSHKIKEQRQRNEQLRVRDSVRRKSNNGTARAASNISNGTYSGSSKVTAALTFAHVGGGNEDSRESFTPARLFYTSSTSV
jgi:hypothetical protein